MSASVRTKLAFATGLAVALITGGLAAVAGPAGAATGAVNYDCLFAGQNFQVSVNTDSNLPAKVYVGDTAAVVVDSDVVLPPELAKYAYDSLQVRSFGGTIAAKATIAGGQIAVNETIPTTSLGDQSTTSKAVSFTASAPTLSFKPTLPGDFPFEADDFTATLNLTKQDGSLQILPLVCTKPSGKAPVIDNTQIVARSTTELILTPATVEYGGVAVATAKVTTAGGTPDGLVTFVVNGVLTKVQVKDGTAGISLDAATLRDKAVNATFAPTDARHYEGSVAAAATLGVSKAATTSALQVNGKRVGQLTTTAVKVVGTHGTVPTGTVTVVLRQWGNKAFHKAKSGTLRKGSRSFHLGRLAQGRYKVVVKYLGDNNHLKSKTVKRFRVRP